MSIIVKRVGSVSETFDGMLEGDPGESLERRCGVCDGELRGGDDVFVTVVRGTTHAIAHRPDCVAALEREIREADARCLVAEEEGDESRRRELVRGTKEVLGKLDEERLKGSEVDRVKRALDEVRRAVRE